MLSSDCRDALERWGIAPGRLLVAVSGGLDSRVLLELLLEVAPGLGLELVVGHVNHQLRGESSMADERFVSDLARQKNLPFECRRVEPGKLRESRSSRRRPTLEEAARELRQEALLGIAEALGARWIATAHHQGDQAETVLLRILRGTGPDGLAAMTAVSRGGRWIRPLLDIDPARLEGFARDRGLDWREDESNQDRSFARNRLRLDWLPGLAESFNPQLLRTLCNLAEAQSRDVEWIEMLVENAAQGRIDIEKHAIQLAFDDWDVLPEALARRLVRRALLAAGLDRDITRVHLSRVLDFLRRGRSVGSDKMLELPRGLTLQRGDRAFVLGPILAENGFRRVDDARVHRRD